jgi:hypothetical protein
MSLSGIPTFARRNSGKFSVVVFDVNETRVVIEALIDWPI